MMKDEAKEEKEKLEKELKSLQNHNKQFENLQALLVAREDKIKAKETELLQREARIHEEEK